jgi:hypothetical protein
MFHFYDANAMKSRQRDFESYEYVEVFETDAGGSSEIGLNKDLFKFRMKDKEAIYNMADAFIEAEFDIVKRGVGPNGTDLPVTTGLVAPVNNYCNLFKDAKFKFNNKEIEENDKIGEICQIKGLLKYDDDYSRGAGKTSLWAPDRFTDKIEEPLEIFARVAGKNCGIMRLRVAGGALVIGPTDGATGRDALAANDIFQLFVITNNGPIEVDVRYTRNDITNGAFATPLIANASFKAGNVADGGFDLILADHTGTNINAEANTFVKSVDLYIRGSYAGLYNGQEQRIITLTNNNAYPLLVTGATPSASVTTVIGWDSGLANTGFYERLRRGYTKTERGTWKVFGHIREMISFWEQNPILMKGMISELEFKRNDFKDSVLCDSVAAAYIGESGRISFKKLKLWVPVVTPTLSMKSLLLDSYNDPTPKTLKWDYSEDFFSNSYNRASLKNTWRIVSTTKRPVRAIIYFKKVARSESLTENNMCFDHLRLNELYIQLGDRSRKYPELPFTPNYETDDYMREYNAYLAGCGIVHNYECKPVISYEEFKTLYPMYVIDLSHLEEGIFEEITDLEIYVKWRLASTVTGDSQADSGINYRVHAIVETERDIEIAGANGKVTLLRGTDQ